MGGFVDVAEDQLALASGIGRGDDAAYLLARQNLLDDLELIAALFIDDERPLGRQHR